MTTVTGAQIHLATWAQDLEQENKRIAEINAARVRNRGYLVFATDPSKGVDSAEYQQVYATEARTPNQAIAKVRPLTEGRRLRAFLTTGKYRDELADARWVGVAGDGTPTTEWATRHTLSSRLRSSACSPGSMSPPSVTDLMTRSTRSGSAGGSSKSSQRLGCSSRARPIPLRPGIACAPSV